MEGEARGDGTSHTEEDVRIVKRNITQLHSTGFLIATLFPVLVVNVTTFSNWHFWNVASSMINYSVHLSLPINLLFFSFGRKSDHQLLFGKEPAQFLEQVFIIAIARNENLCVAIFSKASTSIAVAIFTSVFFSMGFTCGSPQLQQ